MTLPVLAPRPSQWWDGRLAPDFDGVTGRFDPAALEVQLRTEDGPVLRQLTRGDDGTWRRTDYGAANSVAATPLTRTLQELSRLRLVDVVAAAPAPPPAFRVGVGRGGGGEHRERVRCELRGVEERVALRPPL